MTDYHKLVKVDYVDDPDAAEGEKRLLEFIRTAPDEDHSPELREFLEEAFKSILFDGEDPRKALKLETKQGVKSGHAKARQVKKSFQTAIMVEARIAGGMLSDEARQAVANELGVSYKTVKRSHTENYARLAKEQIESWRRLTAALTSAVKIRAADPKKVVRAKKKITKVEIPYCEDCGVDLFYWVPSSHKEGWVDSSQIFDIKYSDTCHNCGHKQDKK